MLILVSVSNSIPKYTSMLQKVMFTISLPDASGIFTEVETLLSFTFRKRIKLKWEKKKKKRYKIQAQSLEHG